MVLFFRTDFLNLTICTTAIYMLNNTDRIKRWSFRVLVFGIFLSLVYDLLWFYLQEQSNDAADGGVQHRVRSFSLSISYLSFFFRVSPICLNSFLDHSSPRLLERLSGFQQDY